MYTSYIYYLEHEHDMNNISKEDYGKNIAILEAHENVRKAAGEAVLQWLTDQEDVEVEDEYYNDSEGMCRAAKLDYARGYNKARSEAMAYALEAALAKPTVFDQSDCDCQDEDEE